PLAAGDANNDDCISGADLAQISADFGKGGFRAAHRPPISDVNGDGVVDSLDIKVVKAQLGRCGPTTAVEGPPAVPSVASLVAYPNPTGGSPTIRFELARD